MLKQKVPDIEFELWVIAELPKLFSDNKIYINKEYQRGDIWTPSQKVELIKSINNQYSIGVLVCFLNDHQQYEVLDGQQRLITVRQYLEDELDLTNTAITKYSELSVREKALLDAYCIYYIRLKSQNPASKEEDIVQTFLRLQEGTPLNKAEKLNAQRGKFKDVFRETRETHPVFQYLEEEKRFRWRQLAAELLTLELESNFDNKIFPSLDLPSMINVIKKYEKGIPSKKVSFFKGNLDYLHNSLNMILTAFQPREFIAFYLLISYLRKKKAGKKNLVNEFAEFAKEFLENLNRFAIYDDKPPLGMPEDLFNKYKTFKLESKIMTTPESIKKRFEIIYGEYDRLHPIIIADPQRLHDAEQKRTLFFRQRGICRYCGKPIDFRKSSGHHIVAHGLGGKTADLEHSALLHERCHHKLEKQISTGIQPKLIDI